MPWARASALHRHLQCPEASWLPVHDRGHDRPPYLDRGRGREFPVLYPVFNEPRDTSAADRGTEAHRRKELGEVLGEMYTGISEVGSHEVTVAFNCNSGETDRLLEATERERTEWKSAKGEDWVVGTMDWWGILDDGTHWVDDLKTGKRKPEVLTAQTLFYAMVVHEVTRGPVAVSATHWPDFEKPAKRYWAHPGILELETFRLDLIMAWRAAMNHEGPRPGAHCQWCPSAAWCKEADGGAY